MINRTFKFYGQAFSASGPVSIVAKFNGQQVYSGTVPTIASLEPQQPGNPDIVWFEHTESIDTHGHIPFELIVTGGTACFGKVEANYSGYEIEEIGETKTLKTAPENYFSHSINTKSIETDGKTNVKINGVNQIRNVIDPAHAAGDWWYEIFENGTFTCDIFVDPDMIITEVTNRTP